MSDALFECVPNVSSGRDPAVLERCAAAVRASGPGVALLSAEGDVDHNRSVLTLAGSADPLLAAMHGLADCALESIDLRRHDGVHRRMGALDVVPFVPLGSAQMADAVALAHRFAAELAERHQLPVFCYGEARRREERRVLGAVRNLGYEELGRRMAAGDSAFAPDFGPEQLHPRSGATAVGARPFLIAWNVQLDSRDAGLARTIAAAVRTSSGGLPAVQAMGFPLAELDCVQVSCNLLDFRQSGLIELFNAISMRAQAAGVSVRDSELIGLAPRAALDDTVAQHIRLRDWDPDQQLLEQRLEAVGIRA